MPPRAAARASSASPSTTSRGLSIRRWRRCGASSPAWWNFMAIREVLRMGHPVLRERAKRIERFGTPELRELVQDMKDTMAAKTGAGLAAPQIGVSERLVIFGVENNPRYPDAE